MAIPTNVAGTAAAARKGRAKGEKADKANGEAPAGEAVAPADAAPKAKVRPAKAETAVKPGAARRREAIESARLLKMAADPTRLQILLMLAEREHFVGEMCNVLEAEQPAVSHHIALCRHAGMIEGLRAGKQIHYSLSDKGRRLVAGIRAVVGGGPGEG